MKSFFSCTYISLYVNVTDSDQRGGGRELTGERRGRGKSRNVCTGPMDEANGGED